MPRTAFSLNKVKIIPNDTKLTSSKSCPSGWRPGQTAGHSIRPPCTCGESFICNFEHYSQTFQQFFKNRISYAYRNHLPLPFTVLSKPLTLSEGPTLSGNWNLVSFSPAQMKSVDEAYICSTYWYHIYRVNVVKALAQVSYMHILCIIKKIKCSNDPYTPCHNKINLALPPFHNWPLRQFGLLYAIVTLNEGQRSWKWLQMLRVVITISIPNMKEMCSYISFSGVPPPPPPPPPLLPLKVRLYVSILGENTVYVTVFCVFFFIPTIEVVTFRLRGWYILGVFVAGIHPCECVCVHTRPRFTLSSESVVGIWSQNPCQLQGKNPLYWKKSPSEEDRTHDADEYDW